MTTSASTVTYSGVFDVVGEIEEPSGTSVVLTYGVDLYKQVWWGWERVGICTEFNSTDGSVNNIDDTVSCNYSNSGENTFRIVGVADSYSQQLGTNAAAYADFYTGSNRIVVDSLSIT